jgi:hypothetical protein
MLAAKNEKFKYSINLYHSIGIYNTMQILHYPRLDTILAVENLLKKAKEPISKNEIDRRLEKKVMRGTLNVILQYLEESGKIAILEEGVLWIYKEDISEKLHKKIDRGITV